MGDFAARDSTFTMPDAGPGYTIGVGVGAMITRIGFHARCWAWLKNSFFSARGVQVREMIPSF